MSIWSIFSNISIANSFGRLVDKSLLEVDKHIITSWNSFEVTFSHAILFLTIKSSRYITHTLIEASRQVVEFCLGLQHCIIFVWILLFWFVQHLLVQGGEVVPAVSDELVACVVVRRKQKSILGIPHKRAHLLVVLLTAEGLSLLLSHF